MRTSPSGEETANGFARPCGWNRTRCRRSPRPLVTASPRATRPHTGERPTVRERQARRRRGRPKRAPGPRRRPCGSGHELEPWRGRLGREVRTTPRQRSETRDERHGAERSSPLGCAALVRPAGRTESVPQGDQRSAQVVDRTLEHDGAARSGLSHRAKPDGDHLQDDREQNHGPDGQSARGPGSASLPAGSRSGTAAERAAVDGARLDIYASGRHAVMVRQPRVPSGHDHRRHRCATFRL